MKLLVSLFLTLNIFAGVGDSAGGSSISARQIQDLLDKGKYDVEIPEYKFDNNMSLRLHRFCNEGNQLRSNIKLPIFEEQWSYHEDQMVSVKIGMDYARRDFEKKNNRTIKIDNEILVRKKLHFSGRNADVFSYRKGRVLDRRVYTLPNCEEIE